MSWRRSWSGSHANSNDFGAWVRFSDGQVAGLVTSLGDKIEKEGE